jgi:protein phosphatase
MRKIINSLFNGRPRKKSMQEPDGQLKAIDGGDLGSQPEKNQDGREQTIDTTIDLQTETVALPDEEVSEIHSQETRPTKVSLDDTAVGLGKTNVQSPTRHKILQALQYSHIGNIRARNEDSTQIFTAGSGGQESLVPFGFYLLADGMGGHYAGHEASKYVVRYVARQVLERIYIPLLKTGIESNGAPPEPVREVMLEAVQHANRHIYNPQPDKGGGTTLTAALIFGRRLYLAHVGDSRAYLMVDNKLEIITDDHSYVHRLQASGQITEEEAAVHPQRNMLYRAVGQGGHLEIDTFTSTLADKGKLMLCSDGLWGLVPDDLIAHVLGQQLPLESLAEQLIGLGLKAGGHDNISTVIVEFNFAG